MAARKKKIVELPVLVAKPILELVNNKLTFGAQSGYRVNFRPDQSNVCPCCGRMAWFVGRLMAECANPKCCAALPIEGAQESGRSTVVQKNYHIPSGARGRFVHNGVTG